MSRSKNTEDRESGLDVGLLLTTLIALRRGDFSTRMPNDWTGVNGKIADTLNDIIDIAERTTAEYARVSQVVGRAGKVDARLQVTDLHGSWANLVESSNSLIEDLVGSSKEIAGVITAVSNGDLSQNAPTEINGIKLEGHFFKTTVIINSMVNQLSTFSSEIIRVAHEQGMEGKLGGRGNIPGVSGIWKELTDNLNAVAKIHTLQMRGIAEVVTAVANGDLSKKVTVEVKGEISDLADTINGMTESLALFANQVTQVAREVGIEGKLGGQANVPGVSGIWKELTDNVNLMAANVTARVRAIAAVATAAAKGDLTDSVTLEVKGEVSELKDNVNEMIRNLRETTNQNSEQVWLKTNLAKFTSALHGQRDLTNFSKDLLSQLAPVVAAEHGAFYLMEESTNGEARLTKLSSFANKERINIATEWKIGEGLVGQCAFEKQRILLTNVPDDSIQITSRLGEEKLLNILVLPIIFEGKVKAVIELASFKLYPAIQLEFLDQLVESLGILLNMIEGIARTNELLKESQTLSEELRLTNYDLAFQAQLLEEQKMEVETKNLEIALAKAAIEEKASQLELASKYKSEFLSNMSHELRTPLNNLLMLSGLLQENINNHLDSKEVEFAQLIHTSGTDLLSLINEILDLSKIESGTVSLNLSELPFAQLHDQIEGVFGHVATKRGLDFEVAFASDLSSTIITDEMRLMQVMKNLLSNAFKFTDKGQVSLRVDRATSGWSTENQSLNQASEVFAFTVEDTGIGISADQQLMIFEAFQQGDGGTARKYGGTGLGLSISREIAWLLGGELALVRSTPQLGSTFVLYVPQNSMHNDSPTPIPESGQTLPSQQQSKLYGKKVLIVDDDARNIFALSAALESRGVVVLSAENGATAIDFLKKAPHMDLVLMDIMMPVMDGYETMREIRKLKEFKKLPNIALTAKAMVGDREKCLEAGASDYLSKPVNIEQISSLMQVWLSK